MSSFYLMQLAASLGGLMVCGVGFTLALVWWSRHPQVSLWASIGFGVLLLGRLGALLMPFLFHGWRSAFGGSAPLAEFSIAYGGLTQLLSGAGLTMLVVAVFGWRRPAAPPFG